MRFDHIFDLIAKLIDIPYLFHDIKTEKIIFQSQYQKKDINKDFYDGFYG